jgi:hypothetical protein
MRHANSAPHEFWALLNAKLDGTLTDDDVDRLEQFLDGDFGLQSLYRNYCQLHINLEEETRAQRVVETARIARSVNRLQQPTPGATAAARAVDIDAVPLQRPRTRRPNWLGISACAVAVALMLMFLVRRNDNPPAGQQAAANPESNVDVITVRLASDESRYLPIGNIGNIHIQGPAHLELYGTSRAKLLDGRIKVRITDPRGRGFVVETPQGKVTDLGTEFGVDVSKGSKGANTGVVVFEGSVDLAVPGDGAQRGAQIQRLVQGEGLSVSNAGQMDRIMNIVTGEVSTFSPRGETRRNGVKPVIVDVFDNIRAPDVLNFYEIVPGGLQEDALAYVDRPAHDWSGVDERGIPPYLIGADYVKMFNADKMRNDVQISVTVSCPARLFIFADNRVVPPRWLRINFRDTGDEIGHDCGRFILNGKEFFKLNRGIGPGKSIDSNCSIWQRVVAGPETIVLGPNFGNSDLTTMYGIAAIRDDSILKLLKNEKEQGGNTSEASQPTATGVAK